MINIGKHLKINFLSILQLFVNCKEIANMEKKENEKSTPVPTPEPEVENHVNQSTEEKQSSNNGILAIIIVVAIILFGLLFFSGWLV